MKNSIHFINGKQIILSLLCFLFVFFTPTYADETDPNANAPQVIQGTQKSPAPKAESSGLKKPVDVDYHENATAKININDFGDFTPVESVGELATKTTTFLLTILGGIAMLSLISAGVMIMNGGFSETAMEKGKDLLLYTVIGVGVALLAIVIVTLAQSFLYSFGTTGG